jgi:hypothetical protein
MHAARDNGPARVPPPFFPPDTKPDPKPTPRGRNLPLGDALGATIDRLRAIAVEAGHQMMTEGPVNPDHQLLEMCGDVLHMLKEAARIKTAARAEWDAAGMTPPREVRDRFREEHDRGCAMEKRAKPMLYHIKKQRATTAAGIYAKALIVRSSVTGAADSGDDLGGGPDQLPRAA